MTTKEINVGTFLAGAKCCFDYTHQAWTVAGKYVRCGHPATMQCQCYGKIHEGERADPDDLR